MELSLTHSAEARYKQILAYYTSHASAKVAHNIKEQLIKKLKLIQAFPQMGKREEQLPHSKQE